MCRLESLAPVARPHLWHWRERRQSRIQRTEWCPLGLVELELYGFSRVGVLRWFEHSPQRRSRRLAPCSWVDALRAVVVMADEFLGREFSEDELFKALEHLKARCPEVLSMIKQRELGRLVVERDEWKDIMFQIVPILE